MAVGAGSGMQVGGPGSLSGILMGGPPPGIAPNSQFGDPSSFTAAANTQASDYDRIMAEYGDLAQSFSSMPLTATQVSPTSVNPVAPVTTPYAQSGDVTNSLSDLSDLSTTGGYSAQGIQDLRARGVSPTRSIYANAQQNVERQKALAGGYSPSFNATQAKMARDESQQISDIDTNVNAGIAQNVAANRIAAAPAYASAASTANAAKTAVDQHNADVVNQVNALNTQIAQQNANLSTQVGEFNSAENLAAQGTNRTGALGAITGQANLYGTTPALTKTFGDQVTQAANTNQGQQQINNQKLNTFGNIAGMPAFG